MLAGRYLEERRTLLAMLGIAVAFALAAGWHLSQAEAQDAGGKFDPAIRPEFHEPVTLASKDGVLEVQGDHAERVVAWLVAEGFKAKRSGG